MSFSFPLPESRAFLRGPETGDASAWETDQAVRRLRADYERWSRLLVGVVAFAAAAGGGCVAVLFAGLSVAWRVLPRGEDLVIGLVALLMAPCGVVVLVRLRRTGRVLTRAAAAWVVVPFRSGERSTSLGGWVAARTVNVEPPIFARIALASLVSLLAVCAWSVAIVSFVSPRDLSLGFGENAAYGAAALYLALLATFCGGGLIAGPMRLANGLGAGDPLWVRVRSMFAR